LSEFKLEVIHISIKPSDVSPIRKKKTHSLINLIILTPWSIAQSPMRDLFFRLKKTERAGI
jgi:hypothetical protein